MEKLNPKSFDAVRVQLQNQNGEWMTILCLPRCGREDDGRPVEMRYWQPVVAAVQGVLDVDLLA